VKAVESLSELQRLITRHAGEGLTHSSTMEGVSLMASATTTPPLGSVAQPALAVVAQGAKRTVLGDSVFQYGAGQYLVVSVDLPVTAHITHANPAQPFLAFGLALKPGAIAELLLETGPGDPSRGSPLGIASSDAAPELLDAIVRLLRLLDHPADLRALRPAVEREILWRLITGEQGAMVRQIGLADSRLSLIGRSVGWIRHHFDQTVRVDELASLSGMSVSSFHRNFRAVTTMTPIQYQKQIRLQEARARLIAQPHDIAGVAFAVGYESPSQFSREYRRRFGVPPGKDAERLREASASVAQAPNIPAT
jgi:AraC-like DNA-binding protein